MANYCTVYVLILAVAFGNVRCEEAAAAPQSFEELVSKAQSTIKDMNKHVTDMLGLPDRSHENVNDIMKNISQSIRSNIDEFIQKASTAANAPDSPLAGVIAKLNETAAGLTTPQMQEKTKHLGETITSSFNSIVTEFGKVAKEINKEAQPDSELGKFAKKTLEDTVAAAKNFEKKIHQAIGPHEGHDHH
ncbi:uncharacterized protein LOC111049575 [Nilaparvata lugens]|uniref:Apolipophorin-iii n=1 Tax=Nilaparvata lugens TaxID=108931 RepID=A0A1I9WL93_NILLU|nr:uncharacterized protein LOC111049575 [Nilaparvata lugens]APA33913.1 seminal fluid protein [Nilaparvata lugens]ASL04991.1 apolipophorin-iii precursor [Nilaparvata lugens]